MTRITTWSAELLKTLPLLSSLTEGELARLASSARRRSFPARACIIAAGQPPDGLYIIVSGRVRLRHQDQDGRGLIADAFGPNEFFGEMGLIDSSPYPATVEAAEACEVVYIERAVLLEYLNDSAPVAMSMLRVALTRLSRAHSQMANLALTDVYGRVAQVLVESGREVDGEWHVDVGSEQIAAMVGASREMVSRVIKCMIEKRLLRRYKRKLIVLERETLAAPANGRNGDISAAKAATDVSA
jgi:CRP/FNR family cyclic AMP-dependent transcriptional regulator